MLLERRECFVDDVNDSGHSSLTAVPDTLLGRYCEWRWAGAACRLSPAHYLQPQVEPGDISAPQQDALSAGHDMWSASAVEQHAVDWATALSWPARAGPVSQGAAKSMNRNSRGASGQLSSAPA